MRDLRRAGAVAGLGLTLVSVPTMARADDGDARFHRYGVFTQLAVGVSQASAMTIPTTSSWGPSVSLHIGIAPAWWLAVGCGVRESLFPGVYETASLGLVGPFVQVWLNAGQNAYARLSGGLAPTTNLAARNPTWRLGFGSGLAVGWEGSITPAWTFGPALQAIYARRMIHDDGSNYGGARDFDQLQVGIAFAGTHR